MSYTGQNITILEGLDPVRKRPGMYIGGTGKSGLHHLIWEVVDNSIDEAINGFASKISVCLHRDGQTVTVSDNGRGIPVDIHPKAGIPTIQVILTTLHAGGKFDQGSYITSGGLHGVGSSVVNALSEELIATIRRDGWEYRQVYRRGKPQTEVEKVKEFRGSGTSIQFKPDSQIFGDVELDSELILNRLEVSAFLNKGLKIIFLDERSNNRVEMQFDGGVADFLTKEIGNRGIVGNKPFILSRTEHPRMDLALCWTDDTAERIRSFVNGIPTQDGGTHEQGLKDAILRSIRGYLDTQQISLPRGIKLAAEDIREGVVGICSCFLAEPQFQGQTKDKLNNPEMRTEVEAFVRPALEKWLLENRSIADALITRMVLAAKARQASRAANSQVRRKSATSRKLNLPGKLADCSNSDPSLCELFIVEGDSAGGSAKQGRNRRTQAILPLRGKVLNAEQATLAKVLGNKELSDIVSALGCGIGKGFNIQHLRYHKIVLLMDADQDGNHIVTLMLTFLYRYMRPLIDGGFVYIAQPPLYRVDVGKDTHWILDDRELVKLKQKVSSRSKVQIARFKGLGEMMPKTLYKTTLDPDNRRLLRVCIPDTMGLETENTISDLMGKDAALRYRAIIDWMKVVDFVDV
jgi:DNA gyrase subunit B/topoisomerase-4 subunit B